MEKEIRVRRVGSFTFGIVLILTGILSLVRLFFPAFNFCLIYRFWPVILILLGIEVLAGTMHKNYEVVDEKGTVKEQSKLVYDVPAILLMVVLTGFTMCLALVDWVYETEMYFRM